jgi:hypothetical protein
MILSELLFTFSKISTFNKCSLKEVADKFVRFNSLANMCMLLVLNAFKKLVSGYFYVLYGL